MGRTIDVRDVGVSDVVTVIVFSEGGANYSTGTHLLRREDREGAITIIDEEDDEVVLESVEQVQNLIKALNKAVELGWVK